MPKTCYMCDAPATSVEHVPPRCLFPAQKDLPPGVDLRKQLITVPACDEHNGAKSKDDEYILYVLVINIPSNDVAKNHFLTKIMRAIQANPSLINQFMSKQQPVVVEDTETGQVFRTIGVEIDRDRFCSAIEHLARALYYAEFGVKLEGEVRVHPDFLLSLDPEHARAINEPTEQMARAADQLFAECDPRGENPDVFTYRVLDGNDRCQKLMRFHFYNGCKVTVFCGFDG